MTRLPYAKRLLRTLVQRSPALKYLYEEIDLLRKYGRFRPDNVRLPGTDHLIYVDPRESRGRALLRGFAGGQPGLKALWRSLYRALEPSVVIDVGANYGEFVFMERYPPGVRAIAIEANVRLKDLLERSRAAHPSHERIELHWGLAASGDGGEERFYVDQSWSGRSSVFAAHVRRGEERRIRKLTVDSLFSEDAEHARARTVLFKIDVEGYEPTVLAGMHRLVAESRWCIGIVELDPVTLGPQGFDLDSYLERLRERFEVYAIGPGRELTLADRRCGEAHDLLLTTDPSLLSRWTTAPLAPRE